MTSLLYLCAICFDTIGKVQGVQDSNKKAGWAITGIVLSIEAHLSHARADELYMHAHTERARHSHSISHSNPLTPCLLLYDYIQGSRKNDSLSLKGLFIFDTSAVWRQKKKQFFWIVNGRYCYTILQAG